MKNHYFAVLVLLTGNYCTSDPTELVGLEGETLVSSYRYPESIKAAGKFFCRFNGSVCEAGVHVNPPQSRAKAGRLSLFDNTSACLLTFTISSLTVEDSGTYWCGSQNDSSLLEVHVIIKQQKSKILSDARKNGQDQRNQRFHFRFSAVSTVVCAGMLLFVCVFCTVHMLMWISSYILSGSTSSHILPQDKPQTHLPEDDYVWMMSVVCHDDSAVDSEVLPPSGSYSHLPPPGASVATNSPDAADHPYIYPEFADPPSPPSNIDPYYAHIEKDLEYDYIDLDASRLSSIYERLGEESMRESVYYAIEQSNK